METKVQEAVTLKTQGCNCAQAVFCTYCEEFGISKEHGYQLTEALGTGISGLQEVCGAFSALTLLIGLANSNGVLNSKDTRGHTYQLSKEAATAFAKECRHLRCHDIIHDVDEQGKRIVPCEECVKVAASLAENMGILPKQDK